MKKLLVLILLGAISVLPINAMDRIQENSYGDSGVASSSAATTEPQAVLGARPATVQAAVDKAFEKNKNMRGDMWVRCGEISPYYLLGLNDEKVLKNLASKGKNDIYIIDVGCARGGWGIMAKSALLNDEVCQRSGTQFHIFSVTGGKECEETVETEGNVTLYQFNQFKIENIDEEFLKRHIDLKNKVDFIVASFTLRHLVDPFGTLKRMYSLLTPLQGMLMSDGFAFVFDGEEAMRVVPFTNWTILAATNAVSLFCCDKSGFDGGQFLLMRNNAQELVIPIEYTSETRKLTGNDKYSGQIVAVVRKRLINEAECFFFKAIQSKDQAYVAEKEDGIRDDSDYSRCFCDKNNQLSKRLYAYLKHQGLFESAFF